MICPSCGSPAPVHLPSCSRVRPDGRYRADAHSMGATVVQPAAMAAPLRPGDRGWRESPAGKLMNRGAPASQLLQLVHEGVLASLLPLKGGFRVTLERGSVMVQTECAYLDAALCDALEAWYSSTAGGK